MTTVGYATFFWTDNRLTWDKTKFGDIDRLRVAAHEVWIPDITVYNMVGPLINMVPTNVIIFNTGMMIWMPYVTTQVRFYSNDR